MTPRVKGSGHGVFLTIGAAGRTFNHGARHRRDRHLLLREAQESRVEARLWGTMQAMEETVDTDRRLTDEARSRGEEREAEDDAGSAAELVKRLGVLKGMLEHKG